MSIKIIFFKTAQKKYEELLNLDTANLSPFMLEAHIGDLKIAKKELEKLIMDLSLSLYKEEITLSTEDKNFIKTLLKIN